MNLTRLMIPGAAVALAATTALTVPAVSAQPANPGSPPLGTEGTCAVSVSTSVNVPEPGGAQRAVELDGMLEVGIQNWANPDGGPGLRPWARVRGGAERWMENAHVEFTTSGIEGVYTQEAQAPVGSRIGGVVVSHVVDVPATSDGDFSVDLPADFDAWGPAWNEGATALWKIKGPAESLGDDKLSAFLTLNADVLPWPQENDDCQPLGVDDATPRAVVADGSVQDTGVVVTGGAAGDHSRMYGQVFLPGTDTAVEGAGVTVNPDGTVSVTLAPGVRDLTDGLDVQLFAQPREDDAAWAPYNNDARVGERFTVAIGDQAEAYAPGYRHAVTNPGVAITLAQNRDLTVPEGTTYELTGEPITDPDIDGWEYTVDPTTGALTVTPPADAQTGDYIVVPVQVTYPDGSVEIIDGHVTVVEEGDAAGGSTGGSSAGDGSIGGSSVDGRCVATAGAVITPLVLLAPLAVASQVDIPGVSPLIRDLQAQLQQANTDLQQGLGINNPEIARLAAQINEALGPDAIRILGGAGVAALSLLAVGVIADACLPGEGGSSGSSLSSE